MAKGVSFRDKFAALYRDGYSVTAIARLNMVTRQVAVELLRGAGFGDVPERYAAPAPPVERIRERRKPKSRISATPAIVPAPANCEARPFPGRVWCAQCDRQVFETEARGCQSRFCKAKAVA